MLGLSGLLGELACRGSVFGLLGSPCLPTGLLPPLVSWLELAHRAPPRSFAWSVTSAHRDFPPSPFARTPLLFCSLTLAHRLHGLLPSRLSSPCLPHGLLPVSVLLLIPVFSLNLCLWHLLLLLNSLLYEGKCVLTITQTLSQEHYWIIQF